MGVYPVGQKGDRRIFATGSKKNVSPPFLRSYWAYQSRRRTSIPVPSSAVAKILVSWPR